MAEDDNNSNAHPYEPAPVSKADSEPQNEPPTDYKRHPVYSPSEWLLESISSFLAMSLLIGIGIIFWYMDNKPLSAWRSGVSLNATISILATACTTALMHGVSTFIAQSKWLHFKNGPHKLADLETFDGASRGVWGSLLLITSVKWNIATLGAFITILRLTFSSFAQQVVLIEQRDIISFSNTATFGIAHNYTRDFFNDLVNSNFESIPQDPGMQSAILRGLFDIDTTEPFNCPGTCRWAGPYVSLGFKAECRNVTQETLQAATCEGRETSLRQCNMTTPGGVGLATRAWFTDYATESYINATSLMKNRSSPILPDTFPEITRFAIYRSTPDHNFQMNDVNITECSLFVTAYEYTGAKANGSDFSFATTREVDFGVKNPWTLEIKPGLDVKFSQIFSNESTSGDIHIPALEMNYATITALQNFFESSSVVTEWVVGSFVNTHLGVTAALSGDVDLNDRFNKMATAMTDYLRYGPNAQPQPGEVVQSEPFVSIRWGYFVVPIVTEALAILFAILSIFSNRRSRHVPLWKSSTLAVLACQHEERLGLLRTTDKDVNEIQAEAEKAEVRLQ